MTDRSAHIPVTDPALDAATAAPTPPIAEPASDAVSDATPASASASDSARPLRVVIAGGGIGGLTLAAALRRRGIDVVCLERDTDLAATGGYHLHLDQRAVSALRSALDPVDFERVLASSATTRVQGGDVMRDMRGRLLFRSRPGDDDGGVNVDRITLRLILARAAGASLRTGVQVGGFAWTADGGVILHTDAGEFGGDVLVGADGVHSRIATALAGGPTNAPTGLLGIGGRTTASALPAAASRLFGSDSGLAIGPGGTGLYIGHHDPVRHPAVAAPHLAEPITTEPTYIWGAVLSESADTDALRPLTGAALRDAVVALLQRAGWTYPMLDVVTATDLDGLATFRFHVGPSVAAEVAPWPAGGVTALGDAVHAMPPTAGMGAATAIHDAAELANRLAAVHAGRVTVAAAMHEFEHGMRQRGAAAITASMRPVGMIHATATPFGRLAARVGLPIGAALARLRRR